MPQSKEFLVIDSHTHVQFAAYDADREAVIARALAAGIGMVNIGTQFSTSRGAVTLADQHPDCVWATVGFHPGHLDPVNHHDPQELRSSEPEAFDIEKLRGLAADPVVVAIGECGLDFYRMKNQELRIKQEEVLRQQIELAQELKKPLVIHCRKAFSDLLRILHSYSFILNPSGVIHFFSGSWDDAQKLLDLGFSVSFGGVITFARDYDDVIKKIPLDRLLVETDAPYVAPVSHRGKRNEPAYIVETVKKIAELRGLTFEEVAARSVENTSRIFGV